MKRFFIIALLIFSLAACISHTRRTRTVKIEDNNKSVKIEDDGKTMSIKVKTKNTEKPIDYNEIFDVRDMNEKQRKSLQTHILDSLQLNN